MIETATFENIVVTDYEDLMWSPNRKAFHKGGPIWPDWEQRTFERHCRDNACADVRPDEPRAAPKETLAEAYFCGPVQTHFGHQLADFSMRVLPSRFERRDANLLFFLARGDAPGWFRDLLGWCEAPPAQTIFVRAPVRVARLGIVRQSEQLWRTGPSDAHLDRMDRFIAGKRLNLPQTAPLVYVSRAGLAPNGGRMAGEGYLEACLASAGAQVIRPETHDIATQMSVYLGAPRLVFAEGSALHLCQFAGRAFGEVDVLLRRRPAEWRGLEFGASFMRPRCRRYRAIDLIAHVVEPYWPGGAAAESAGLALLDVERAFAYFGGLGIDIARSWDAVAYRAAVDRDVDNWLKANTGPGLAFAQDSDARVAAALRAAGLDAPADALAGQRL